MTKKKRPRVRITKRIIIIDCLTYDDHILNAHWSAPCSNYFGDKDIAFRLIKKRGRKK
jgi:hypothetical protein